jgi:hypothetical protein
MFGRLLYVLAVMTIGVYGVSNPVDFMLISFWLIASLVTIAGVVAVVDFIIRGPQTPEQKAKDAAQIEAFKECFKVK